jgi:thiamine biosynthesis protein ThiS
MRVRLNGSETKLDDDTTLSSVVRRYGRGERGIAVALNGEVVARSRWNDVKLSEGDRVEVLGAIGGGEKEMEQWTTPSY